MTEPQKTSHWQSLAESLGADAPPTPASAAVPPSPSASPPVRPAFPPADRPKPRAAAKKGDWGSVANALGLAPPPEPAKKPEPPSAEPAAPAALEPQKLPREYEPRRDSRALAPRPPEREAIEPEEPVTDDEELTLAADDSDVVDEIELELVEEEDAALPSPEEVRGEEDERAPRRRRRRRRGRRQRRGEGSDETGERAEESAEPVESGEPDAASPRGRGESARDDESRAEGRSRGRKRRRGRRRSGGRDENRPRRPAADESAREEEATFISESGSLDELDADFGPEDIEDDRTPFSSREHDEHEPESGLPGDNEPTDEDEDGELEHSGKKHKIPSWQETIGLLIDHNLAARGKSSGGQRGGRGRGRGRR